MSIIGIITILFTVSSYHFLLLGDIDLLEVTHVLHVSDRVIGGFLEK